MNDNSKDGNDATATATTTKPQQVFKKLDASEQGLEDNGLAELDSLCVNCMEQGRTKLMLTRIPFYRDVVISSFQCDHCHFKNNGIDSANKIQDQGIRMKLTVTNEVDLNRSLVKSDYAVLKIPSIDLEIPALTQKGLLTTIEGVLQRVSENLKNDIELRRETDKETTDKLEIFVQKIEDLRALKSGSFEVIVDDPSGDSFIENPFAPKKDEKLTVFHYKRNEEQNTLLGIENDQTIEEEMVAQQESDLKQEVKTILY
jgi:zinc finger protein